MLQGATVVGASAAFLVQRILFMCIIENVPKLDCYMLNGVGYICLLVLRLSVVTGVYSRTLDATKSSLILRVLAILGLMMALASVVILMYYAWTSPYIPGLCLQALDERITTSTNILLVWGLSILAVVAVVPIIKAMANLNRGVEESDAQRRARYVADGSKFFPLVFCVSLIAMSLSSPSASTNIFGFLSTLVFSDFCQVWLLLFPMVAVAQGSASSKQQSYSSTKSDAGKRTMLRAPAQTREANSDH
nr:hypothetical protein HK105_006085 [Polyrhizophydium stewartii]